MSSSAPALPPEPASIAWSAGLRALGARFGERVAVRTPRATLAYAQLDERAHALAAQLAGLGIAAGEPVATSLPNCVEAVWASYGITALGAAETPMHHALTAEEARWFTGLAGAKRVVTYEARRAFFEGLGLRVILVEEIGEDPGSTFPPVSAQLRGRILSSSGTTGRPKAIVYTHARRWLGNELLKSVLPFVPQSGERILLFTPFPHGTSLLTFAWLDHGAEVVLHEGVERAAVEAVLSQGVAAVFAPPTVINKLAELFPEERFRGVRCVFTGTQTLTEATYRRAERLFGPVVRVTYGKSECVNPITVLSPEHTAAVYEKELRADGACLGWPAEGVELEIRDGEIWLRAKHMANGYIDAAGFHEFEGGWHATGDAGWIDERGRLWLAGRLADIVKTGGYKVQPEEVEAALAGLSRCGQVVVTSLASDYWGEVIVAATENASEGWIEEGKVRVESLSKQKHPRAWVALDALPRNPQGKVSRKEVAKAIAARYSLADG
ncbi:MAG TPA: class I adenylate-forming enzyme family protein, partial [Burkholderiales bacterium]